MIVSKEFDERNLTGTGGALLVANKILIGISVDADEVDFDTAAWMLMNNGRLGSSRDFVFYNNKKSSCDSVYLDDDSDSGEEVYDERLFVTLNTIPSEIQNVLITISVYQEGQYPGRDFRNLERCSVTIHSLDDGGRKIADVELKGSGARQSTMETVTLSRVSNGWQLIVNARFLDGGLEGLIQKYLLQNDQQEVT